MEPYFSVIVPVYKVENFFSQCVDSILSQKFSDFELILVDDGSPDRCPQMCDEYASMDDRVKVIHKENGGLVSARKAGTLIASGKYVVVVDSDDWIEGFLLERLHSVIEKSRSDVVCYNFFLAGNEYIEKKCTYAEGLYEGEELDIIRNRYLYDPDKIGINSGPLPNSIWSKAVRRDLYSICQQLVPDDMSKGEDLLFTLYLFERCSSVYLIDYCGYYYRDNPNSITKKISDDEFVNLSRLTELMLAADPLHRDVYTNKTCIFTFTSFWKIASGIARRELSRSEYVRFMEKIFQPDFDRYFSSIRLSRNTLKGHIKLLLVRRHKWAAIYCIARAKKRKAP